MTAYKVDHFWDRIGPTAAPSNRSVPRYVGHTVSTDTTRADRCLLLQLVAAAVGGDVSDRQHRAVITRPTYWQQKACENSAQETQWLLDAWEVTEHSLSTGSYSDRCFSIQRYCFAPRRRPLQSQVSSQPLSVSWVVKQVRCEKNNVSGVSGQTGVVKFRVMWSEMFI